VFFSRANQKDKGNYPFGLVPDPKGGVANQPYMALGTSYLFSDYGFIPEMAAKDIPTVLVMPICKHGDWGPIQGDCAIMGNLR
jgi:hypothetical protein